MRIEGASEAKSRDRFQRLTASHERRRGAESDEQGHGELISLIDFLRLEHQPGKRIENTIDARRIAANCAQG